MPMDIGDVFVGVATIAVIDDIWGDGRRKRNSTRKPTKRKSASSKKVSKRRVTKRKSVDNFPF